MHDMQPSAATLDSLRAFPFLGAEDIERLKFELPQYLTKFIDLDVSFDLLQWWHSNSGDLSYQSPSTQKVLLIQPSPTASERVFLLLNASFQDQQDNTLEERGKQ